MKQRTHYADYYRNEIKAITGHFPVDADGMAEEEFNRTCTLPQIPLAIREYYLVAGKHRLNTVFNPLYPPGELELRDGFLFFMDENQVVCRWGIKESDLTLNDPEVFQMHEHSKGEVTAYSEQMTFSSYMAYALTYYAMTDEECDGFEIWEQRLELYMIQWKKHRICVFCDKLVEDLDEFQPFGFITMDQADPKYRFNYRGAHRECLNINLYS